MWRHPLACCLGGIVPAQPRLHIFLHRIQGRADSMPMSLASTLIVAKKCRDTDRLRRIERQIPTGAMAEFFAGLGLNRVAVFNQLFTRFRVLAFGEPVKCFSAHLALQIEGVRELAVPLTAKSAALREIGVRGRGILRSVLPLHLAACEWL
jgi:hypothetical protein